MLSRLSVRHASAAAARSTASHGSAAEQSSKTSNGLTVASVDRQGAVSHLVLAFRAGSRYQAVHQKGLVHHLRNFVGRDSQQYMGVPLVWSTASIGANMTSFSTRDVFGVRLSVPRESTGVALSILGHVAAQPSFKPWELEEIESTLSADLAYKKPFDIVFEDVHRAAYRTGSLGNSLYATSYQIGKYGQDELRQFAEKHLVSGNGVLFGVNIEHDNLVAYGESHAPIDNGQGVQKKASPFAVGDVRHESKGNMAHIIVAGEGARSSDVKASAVQSVLLAVLGQGTPVKYGGKTGNGVLPKAISENGGVSSFQASYEDSGLVGAYIVSEAASAGVTVRSVVKGLKGLKVEDLGRAKAIARNSVLVNADCGVNYSIDRAAQVLAGTSENALLQAIEQVSAQEVEAAAKKMVSKIALASYGNIDHVPYVDEL